MVSKLLDGSLHHVNVNGDAKTITWLREDDGELIGINKSSAKNMRIEMSDKSISKIKYYLDIDETLYPEKDIKEKDRYLDGFNWRDEERPKDKSEIFN